MTKFQDRTLCIFSVLFFLCCVYYNFGCSSHPDYNCTFPDGSDACDDGPVMAYDLWGTWTGPGIKLEVVEIGDALVYSWTFGDCLESGTLTGGVEFNPGHGSCFGHSELYSASVDRWTNGVTLYIDGQDGAIYLTYDPS